jgi:predicted nucleotidyltransferase
MEVGINNHLKKICSKLLIKPKSLTGINIARSVDSISRNIHTHFQEDVTDVMVFGSYSRDTLLPREYDPNSDVDILILFASDNGKLKPESYRERLKKFASQYYQHGKVVKDHPSIVVELDHINFDLVPAIFDEGVFYDSFEIPGKENDWIETNPKKFNKTLVEANTRCSSILKPIIRALKYWNASNGYPYSSSFELESMLADLNYSGDNYQQAFFYAIDKLETWNYPGVVKQKVEALQKKAEYIKKFLDNDDLTSAKRMVSKMLPGF